MNVREWRPSDTDTVLEWVEQDPETVRGFGLEPGVTPEQVAIAITRGILSRRWKFGIVENGEGPMAAIGAFDVEEGGVKGVQGHIAINPEHRDKLRSITKVALSYAFDKMGVDIMFAVMGKERERFAQVLGKAFGFNEPPNIVLTLRKEEFNGHSGN